MMETRRSCSVGNQKRPRRIARNIIVFATSSDQPQSTVDQKREAQMQDKLISHGWHFTYGWLRRREEDRSYGFCYEDGDGDLVYTPNPRHRDRVYLECRQDAETGEKYLCFGNQPFLKTR